MLMQRVQDILKQAMGLDSGSVGQSAIERAVLARCRACGLDGYDSYLELLTTSAPELQQLIETVAVPETWFFRDPKAFDALAAHAIGKWLPKHKTGTFRLLSMPCSTGEEPYSMAMALLDAGFPADRFLIDGMDISERVLELGRRATYGRNSFRGRNLEFRDRYFEAAGERHALSERIRRNVRLTRGNLLDAAFGVQLPAYDVIFCRNLLIYFDVLDQARAVAVLHRMLAEDGMLFIGHSEAGLLIDKGFTSARLPLAFAFHKAMAAKPAPRPVPPRAAARAAASSNPPQRAPRGIPVLTPVRAAPAADAATALDAIQKMADNGRLAEASAACDAHIKHHGPSAEAFYLLGMISHLAGDGDRADACYRRVLYLEPGHQQALLQLALLLRQRGDQAGADLLNERSRRLLQAGAR